MRRLIMIMLLICVPQMAFASGGAEPSQPIQYGIGCAVGGTTVVLLTLAGTLGLASIPAIGIGCGIGAVAFPVFDVWHFFPDSDKIKKFLDIH
jgi:tetrahydromethanopterin S-methyltransferase subunit E